MRSAEQIQSEISRILSLVVDEQEFSIECVVDGEASGIPIPIIDALDGFDETGRTSETLHLLIVELSNAMVAHGGATNKIQIRRTRNQWSFELDQV